MKHDAAFDELLCEDPSFRYRTPIGHHRRPTYGLGGPCLKIPTYLEHNQSTGEHRPILSSSSGAHAQTSTTEPNPAADEPADGRRTLADDTPDDR